MSRSRNDEQLARDRWACRAAVKETADECRRLMRELRRCARSCDEHKIERLEAAARLLTDLAEQWE